MLRRIVPVLLLLCFTASSLEAVTGLVRTGETHSESAVSEAPATVPGADGPAPHRHRDDHRHENGADHCAHAHPPALLPAAAVVTVPARALDSGPAHGREPREGPALPIPPHPPKV